MPQPVPPSPREDEHLPRTIAGILLALAVSIAGLYWITVHFN